MREHDSLRKAGSSRGVHDGHEVFGGTGLGVLLVFLSLLLELLEGEGGETNCFSFRFFVLRGTVEEDDSLQGLEFFLLLDDNR